METIEKFTFLLLIIGIFITNILTCNSLQTLVKDRTSRVTEVKHIANIEHFYGNLPVGDVYNEPSTNKIRTIK